MACDSDLNQVLGLIQLVMRASPAVLHDIEPVIQVKQCPGREVKPSTG